MSTDVEAGCFIIYLKKMGYYGAPWLPTSPGLSSDKGYVSIYDAEFKSVRLSANLWLHVTHIIGLGFSMKNIHLLKAKKQRISEKKDASPLRKIEESQVWTSIKRSSANRFICHTSEKHEKVQLTISRSHKERMRTSYNLPL